VKRVCNVDQRFEKAVNLRGRNMVDETRGCFPAPTRLREIDPQDCRFLPLFHRNPAVQQYQAKVTFPRRGGYRGGSRGQIHVNALRVSVRVSVRGIVYVFAPLLPPL
jgi:hypothetical protein